MYDDTMEYMDGAFAEAGDHFGNYACERLVQTVLSRFAYFRSYHGCRPLSMESYFRRGFLPLTRERLAEIAFELFEGKVTRDEITRRAESADLETRLGCVYFMADADELVSYCGHYLIYGPESLSCLWDIGNDRDHALFLESQERRSSRGVPTVFECDVPVGWIIRHKWFGRDAGQLKLKGAATETAFSDMGGRLDTGPFLDHLCCMSAAALQLKKALADAIKHQMQFNHLSISSFAKKTKTNREAVRRILDGKNTSITLKTMAKAAEALNLEMTLTVKQFPLGKLRRIAGQLASTDDAHKAAELKKQFLEGYYGKPVNQLDA